MIAKLIVSLAALGMAWNAMASSYELRRIYVSDEHEYEVRCHFTPGVVQHIVNVNNLSTEQDIAIRTDDAAIQALVDAAPGVPVPPWDGLRKSYTNWWVRSSPTAEFKLIRSNTLHNPGGSLLQDDSAAGKTLAEYMGINCFTTAGQ